MNSPVSAPGRNDEDELYETYIVETNRVYRLVDDQLQLSEQYSGTVLKHAMLRSKEVTTMIVIIALLAASFSVRRKRLLVHSCRLSHL